MALFSWASLASLLLFAGEVGGKEYAMSYSFMADRSECDGQCTYCSHSHNQRKWSDIRTRVSQYVYRPKEYMGTREGREEHAAVQELIDWSWTKGASFECIIGIIGLRLLSYGYSDPLQFNDGESFDVLDFLDIFNAHTGTLDLLTSSWAALLAGGWPIFKELWHVGRKLKDRMNDTPIKYPNLQERANECDKLSTKEDIIYMDAVIQGLETGELPAFGNHLVALRRGSECPAGTAVAFLSMALDMVRRRGMYQGSLKDPDNLVYSLVIAAQDAINAFTVSKPNWSAFFDLLTTRWPLWELLSELACVDSSRNCVTRSMLQCYDPIARQSVPCQHEPAKFKQNFAGCGEHDICTWPDALNASAGGVGSPASWCVPHNRRVAEPRRPFLRTLGHDQEERVCSQCGQDGVLRAIFQHIGFRDATRLVSTGGPAPFFVEFGARKPGMLNSAVIREYCGWDGILMDSQPGETPHGGCRDCPGVADIVRTEFVTADNVVSLFHKHGVPKDLDLLTIDTDYNDYWIWRALLQDGTFRPRVVALDFNPDIALESAKAVRYEEIGEWDGTVYTVASLLAYSLMARAHGYSFAYALEMGAHAFFVRSDLLAEEDLDVPLRNVKKNSHPHDPQDRQFVDVLYEFVPGGSSALPSAAAPSTNNNNTNNYNNNYNNNNKYNNNNNKYNNNNNHNDNNDNHSSSSGSGSQSSELTALRHEVRGLAAEVRELRTALASPKQQAPVRAPAAQEIPKRTTGLAEKSAASGFYEEVRQRR